jgi:hypothetical protein
VLVEGGDGSVTDPMVLPQGTLTISIQDKQGNLTRIDWRCSVGGR